jgi:hypothetical protein
MELKNMGVQTWRKEFGIEQTGHLTNGEPNIKSSHVKEKEEEDDDDDDAVSFKYKLFFLSPILHRLQK